MSDRERPDSATQALAASLEPYTKRELADMMAHVVKTYVIDGTTPNRPELGIIDFPKHLRDLNFTQLISHLKMHLDLPELNLFNVTGTDVMVKIGGRDYSLTDPHAAPGPPPAQSSAPAASGAPAHTPAPATPAAPAAPAAEEKPAEPEKVEVSDRFRMLELD